MSEFNGFTISIDYAIDYDEKQFGKRSYNGIVTCEDGDMNCFEVGECIGEAIETVRMCRPYQTLARAITHVDEHVANIADCGDHELNLRLINAAQAVVDFWNKSDACLRAAIDDVPDAT